MIPISRLVKKEKNKAMTGQKRGADSCFCGGRLEENMALWLAHDRTSWVFLSR